MKYPKAKVVKQCFNIFFFALKISQPNKKREEIRTPARVLKVPKHIYTSTER